MPAFIDLHADEAHLARCLADSSLRATGDLPGSRGRQEEAMQGVTFSSAPQSEGVGGAEGLGGGGFKEAYGRPSMTPGGVGACVVKLWGLGI